jgi:hypothetical protein
MSLHPRHWYDPCSWIRRSVDPTNRLPNDIQFNPKFSVTRHLVVYEFQPAVTVGPGILGIRLLATDSHSTCPCSTDIGLDHPARNLITAYPLMFKYGHSLALFIPTATGPRSPPDAALLYVTMTKRGLIYWDPSTRQPLTETEANTRVNQALSRLGQDGRLYTQLGRTFF